MKRRRHPYGLARLVFLVIALIVNSTYLAPAGAQSVTGSVQGTVTNKADGKPIPNATVNLVAPTGAYSTATDKRGVFSIVGVVPGSYTLSIDTRGYEIFTASNLAVASGQIVATSAMLVANLSEIGRIGGSGNDSAFQPGLTTNSYSASGDMLKTLRGNEFDSSQEDLLKMLPSITLDEHGGIFIRGGNSFQTSYQLEGVDMTTPNVNIGNPNNCTKFVTNSRQNLSCTNQSITNIADFGILNGISSVQVIPGGTDSTVGDSGTGVISYQVKRGTPQGFGSLDAETNVFPNDYQYAFNYGKATNDGAFSAFISVLQKSQNFQYGYLGVPAWELSPGLANNPAYQQTTDALGNFVLKFGNNKRQSVQFLTESQYALQQLDYGGIYGAQYEVGSANFVSLVNAQNGQHFDAAELERFYPLFPGQPYYGAPVTTSPYDDNKLNLYKIQYTNNFSSNTFLSAGIFRQNTTQDAQEMVARGLYMNDYGGTRDGANLQLATQANAQNLVELGGSFEYSQPSGFFFNDDVHLTTFYSNSWDFPTRATVGAPIFDFFPANDPNCANFVNSVPTVKLHDCGYLAQFFPGQANLYLPNLIQTSIVTEQTGGVFLQDTYSPTSNLRIQYGGRLETYIESSPPNPAINPTLTFNEPGGTPGYVNIRASQIDPHIGVSYEFTPNDSIRSNFGTTLSPQVPGTTGSILDNNLFSAFENIPSHDALTGGPAMYCGATFNQLCKNYADELYWSLVSSNQYYYGNLEPAKATSYANYDLSYQHAFGKTIGFRATGYYRRGYNLIEEASEFLGYDPTLQTAETGPTQLLNDGTDRATGLELSLTREVPFGLVGSLSMTYLNERTSANAFTNNLSAASLALGDTYRVQTFSPLQLSLALAYKTRSGFRYGIETSVNDGYPYGDGTTTPVIVNGMPTTVAYTNAEGGHSLLVDPQNPGSIFNPVIAARWGSPDTASSGGILGPATANTNITLEYSKPGSRLTWGLKLSNVFNQLYSYPYVNNLLQPVATGVAGPLTGISNCNGAALIGPVVQSNGPALAANQNNVVGCSFANTPNYYANSGFTKPYVIFPDLPPREVRVYLQVAL